MTYPKLSSSPSAPLPLQDGVQEPDELTRFRNDWRQEVGLHNRATSIDNASVSLLGVNGPLAGQHYSAEGLPQVQESFTTIVDLLFRLHISEDVHDPSAAPKSVISRIIQGFPRPLTFEREEETEPLHITSIPDELLVYILRFLDHGTIERFAAISRKARVLTLDSTIWRDFVALGYKPPQIPYPEAILDLVKTYGVDFRRLYMETPRLRLDGVYIAVCRYLRPGLSENAWINITHEIIYHRYLRFFPDGTVVSLLTSDQTRPRDIIPILNPSLRMTGLYLGFWELHDSVVYISSLADPTGSSTMPYMFHMTLRLTSRPLGKWNRLAILAYDSVHVESGEMIPVSINQEKTQFAFSKVKSYGY